VPLDVRPAAAAQSTTAITAKRTRLISRFIRTFGSAKDLEILWSKSSKNRRNLT